MLNVLSGFDPIDYLSIDTSSLSKEDIKTLRGGLNEKIGQYILLKFSEHLPEDQSQQIMGLTDGEEMIKKLQEVLPNMEGKLQEELENFKREYLSN